MTERRSAGEEQKKVSLGYKEGAMVIVSSDLHKEKGLVIEKKDKMRGTTKLSPVYKVKMMNGNTQWVPEAVLQEMNSSFVEESAPMVPWPKIYLSQSFKEILLQERREIKENVRKPNEKLSVREIFEMFGKYQTAAKPQNTEEIKEAVKGLKELFLFSVHTNILYKEEIEVYEKELYPDAEKILETYGLTHILRMLLSAQTIQKKIQCASEHSNHAMEYLKSFINFLDNNQKLVLE